MQVAGQKSQLFPGLHGRAGQNNAGHILALERLDRHGHRQIGFAGARRPHAEGDGVFADGRQILLLAQRFGMDGAALRGDCHKIIGQLPQALFLAAFGQTDAVPHRLFLQRGMVLHQRHHAVHRTGGGGNALRLTDKFQLGATAYRRHTEFLLQQAHVLISAAENCRRQFDAVQLHRCLCQMPFLPK